MSLLWISSWDFPHTTTRAKLQSSSALISWGWCSLMTWSYFCLVKSMFYFISLTSIYFLSKKKSYLHISREIAKRFVDNKWNFIVSPSILLLFNIKRIFFLTFPVRNMGNVRVFPWHLAMKTLSNWLSKYRILSYFQDRFE